MGTRSITIIKDEEQSTIAVIYQQYDGYPEGWGKDLIEYIKSKTMVNGIGADKNVFNGIYDFTAQLIAHFKKGVGNLYIYPDIKTDNLLDWYEHCWAEYVYIIDHKLEVSCYDVSDKEVKQIVL